MGQKFATGLARCSVCETKIPEGTSCYHHVVNSRAAPFFCRQCLQDMLDQVDGKLIRRTFMMRQKRDMETRVLDDWTVVNNEHLGKFKEPGQAIAAVAAMLNVPVESCVLKNSSNLLPEIVVEHRPAG